MSDASPQPRRPLSSSSSSSSGRPVVRSVEDDEEEDAKKRLRHTLAQFGFRPASWCRRYEGEQDLVALLKGQPLEVPAPDAIEWIGRYGAQAVEGAAFRTLAHMRGGFIKRPRGLLLAALAKGWYWDERQIELFLDGEWEAAAKAAEGQAKDNLTLRRLLDELAAPSNVTPMRRAQ